MTWVLVALAYCSIGPTLILSLPNRGGDGFSQLLLAASSVVTGLLITIVHSRQKGVAGHLGVIVGLVCGIFVTLFCLGVFSESGLRHAPPKVQLLFVAVDILAMPTVCAWLGGGIFTLLASAMRGGRR